MSSSKDKRTKEQILKLLDKAIEQEERFADKIKSLETELADCRKKVEDPRSELTEEALSGSKVSFRIDYYRTAEKSPQKGIIEHLPSRQNKAFEGEGLEAIGLFIGRFLNEEPGNARKKKPASGKEIMQEPDIRVVREVKTEVEETEENIIRIIESDELIIISPSSATTTVGNEGPAEAAAPGDGGKSVEETPVFQGKKAGTSNLLQRLKAELSTEPQAKTAAGSPRPPVDTRMAIPSAEQSQLLERVRERTAAEARKTPGQSARPAETGHEIKKTQVARPRLLERLREEFHKNL